MHTATEPMPLYQAILARRSVRRYHPDPLDSGTLLRVREIIDAAHPLVPENRFAVLLRDGMLIDEDFMRSMGSYGYILSPPHAIAPYLIGDRHPLVDLGYRVQQIVIRLTVLQIGTCYVGCLTREDTVRNRLGLPGGSRCGALVVFGYPATSVGGKAVNALIRSIPGGDARLPADQISFIGSFATPGPPPSAIAPIIEAARLSPSAVNAQPWRFLWDGDRLHLFVKRDNRKYGRGAGQAYSLYDGGICMANASLAVEALDVKGEWSLYDHETQAPKHPQTLQPLAVLQLA